MRTADRLRSGFGQAEVPDLALRDQIPDRARDLFYRHIWIDSVLVQQVDGLNAEASGGGVGGLPDQLGRLEPTCRPSTSTSQVVVATTT